MTCIGDIRPALKNRVSGVAAGEYVRAITAQFSLNLHGYDFYRLPLFKLFLFSK